MYLQRIAPRGLFFLYCYHKTYLQQLLWSNLFGFGSVKFAKAYFVSIWLRAVNAESCTADPPLKKNRGP